MATRGADLNADCPPDPAMLHTGYHAASVLDRAYANLNIDILMEDGMSRRKPRVPVQLEDQGIDRLSDDEIRIILRGADDLIMLGGRTLLAKLLKGSKEKMLLERGLDRSPAYGALRSLNLSEIQARIDWLILNGFLRIQYDGRLPLLVYTRTGWAIERETYTTEWLGRIDGALDRTGGPVAPTELNVLNREVILQLLDRIEASGDPKYRAFLETWSRDTMKKVRGRITRALLTLGGAGSR